MNNSLITKEIEAQIVAHRDVLQSLSSSLIPDIHQAAKMVLDCLKKGNKIILFGNGGSAGDAQHIAAELTGRFKTERKSLPGLAITTDTSALTAIANDYGYHEIFARQISGLARANDTLIGITTSGNSPNVVAGLKTGKELGCTTIGLTGEQSGKIAPLCDVIINVPSRDTARIQEMHILIGHIICQVVDQGISTN